MNRSIVYIDGFNLYYGAIRGGPHKWLNLQDYFTRVRQADVIQRIYYFTAMVNGLGHRYRQEVYLRALETLPLVKVILGRYKLKQVECGVTQGHYNGRRMFQVPEEKRTDVNIAIQMLDDAYHDACDRLILVSGDSDLVPSINRIKVIFPQKQVYVYVPSRNPTRGAAVELRSSADHAKDLPLSLLGPAQFPVRIPDGSGGVIQKPVEW